MYRPKLSLHLIVQFIMAMLFNDRAKFAIKERNIRL